MASNTPGPWFIVWSEDGDEDSGGTGEYFASEIVSGNPESNNYVDLLSKGNAPLVASAPTMLAALEDIYNFLKRSGYDTRLIKEVISEAKGEDK